VKGYWGLTMDDRERGEIYAILPEFNSPTEG